MTSTSMIDEPDLLAAIHRGGWVKPEERLTLDQRAQLCALLGERLLSDRRADFNGIIDVAFGHAVRAERTIRESASTTKGRSDGGTRLQKGRTKLTKAARDEVTSIVKTAKNLFKGLSSLSPIGSSALDLMFERAQERVGVPNGDLSLRRVRERLLNDLGHFIVQASAVEIDVRKGGSDPAYRLMVRALAGLFHGVTGEMPARAYVEPETSRSGQHGEGGLLLDLATRMASFVNAALPPELQRTEPPKLTGIVRDEIERLRGME